MTPPGCFVCKTPTVTAFSKTFDWHGLERVDYVRCPACGFVLSQTHAEMGTERWAELNRIFHHERTPESGRSSESRWMQRLQGYADAIGEAASVGAIDTGGSWLDFGCGSGKLAELIEARTRHPVLRYEPFLPQEGPQWVETPGEGHSLVVNTAMFEHVRDRSPLDAVAGGLGDDGVLALHTVVGPRVPDDPEWFYLLPVHCAFFTNESMRRLCAQWGIAASAYHVEGRLWLLARRAERLAPLRDQAGWQVSDGFLAYWT